MKYKTIVHMHGKLYLFNYSERLLMLTFIEQNTAKIFSFTYYVSYFSLETLFLLQKALLRRLIYQATMYCRYKMFSRLEQVKYFIFFLNNLNISLKKWDFYCLLVSNIFSILRYKTYSVF